MSREIERLQRRRTRLERLQKQHEHVCARRRMVHSAGLKPRHILVRREFLQADATGHSPIARLITPRGVALQTFLVALFEAQCMHRYGTNPVNNRVLRATERGEIGWLDLVASVADADPANSVERTTEQGNLLRQVKAALRTLAAAHLARLAGGTTQNGRFEAFEIGHESGGDDFLPYTVPRVRLPGLIRVPVDFFLKGWAHVLSPAEIATYLMFSDLASQFPSQHKENGVFVAGSTRERLYGLRRDIYEAHRSLTDFRLVERLPDPKRWPNGRIRNYRELTNRGEVVSSHRFRLLDSGFNRDALRVVKRGLENYKRAGESTAGREAAR
ncbi:hypothetical protein [Amycolatopsis aidingensis]|uniref:hypothetical protein n=1 Tax=Amycolatopsis aidingensis TaxID=2842453 RepID=UPI001C0CA73B|nr:hypothetical protein [Amycolatopsis aidingensis]